MAQRRCWKDYGPFPWPCHVLLLLLLPSCRIRINDRVLDLGGKYAL